MCIYMLFLFELVDGVLLLGENLGTIDVPKTVVILLCCELYVGPTWWDSLKLKSQPSDVPVHPVHWSFCRPIGIGLG